MFHGAVVVIVDVSVVDDVSGTVVCDCGGLVVVDVQEHLL